ncbi:hypothetical protein J2TS4_05320 [Paenibacillus sp. J2TS4]|nr:hypothetical protein J2TS4_05320 [Paenibacillus sp. J2TS4]
MLLLAGVEYVTGSESIAQTGELHALQGEADPQDMQAFTYCFAVDHLEGEDWTISRRFSMISGGSIRRISGRISN